ncbi:MAG: RtcB family protein [Phycisphaeraceae bacterium]|nr:RtcB family protein [Phycisphaeraceae bacterium]
MKAKQIEKLGIPRRLVNLAKRAVWQARQNGLANDQIRLLLADLAQNPQPFLAHTSLGELARRLCEFLSTAAPAPTRSPFPDPHGPCPGGPLHFVPRPAPAPWQRWGIDLDDQSVQQMENACRLPVTVAGALMPDAHLGYGLPIGGVLAADNAVIPYAVGVDIACRMKLSVLDLPPSAIDEQPDRLIQAIETQTRFGIGSEFKRQRRDHPVLEEDWSVSPVTANLRDKAWAQLGTSGSGNHFVEFGRFTLDQPDLGLPAGTYLALLSHSGSRGCGALICQHYSRLAMALCPQLPKDLRHLAWLSLSSQEGNEYWAAMQLMGRYAAANHALIHKHIAQYLGLDVLLDIENHHNFAWKQDFEGQEVIVHRKGATPAQLGVLGVIPGSMASPGFVVRGKGNPASLHSAAHGAGRAMSRTQAKNTYRWPPVQDYLRHHHVTLLSAGLDEVPFVYKDIHTVMAQQQDLVQVVARFDPRIVKMAPAGERPED